VAITAIEYAIFTELRSRGLVGGSMAVLELGEANWYGDVETQRLADDIRRFAPPARQGELFATLQAIIRDQGRDPWALFRVAKVFYATFLEVSEWLAIDMHGSPEARRHDLNQPLRLHRQFDLVLNLGTAEHVLTWRRCSPRSTMQPASVA
jgi:hypothetical protein